VQSASDTVAGKADSLSDAARRAAAGVAEQAKSAATDAVGAASGFVQSASDTVAGKADALSDAARRAAASAAENVKAVAARLPSAGTYSEAAKRASDAVGGYPMILGGIGLLLGGAVAGALPSARVEQSAVGTIRRRSAAASGDVIDAAKQRVREASNAGADAISDSHLAETASDRLRSLIGATSETVSTVIQTGLNSSSRENEHG
jgi:hypothetical protein